MFAPPMGYKRSRRALVLDTRSNDVMSWNRNGRDDYNEASVSLGNQPCRMIQRRRRLTPRPSERVVLLGDAKVGEPMQFPERDAVWIALAGDTV